MKAEKIRTLIAASVLATGLLAGLPAQAADGVKAGFLTCHVASGWGFIFASTRDLSCSYSPDSNQVAYGYLGHISKFGVDIGYTRSGVMVWAVFAPTRDIGPEALTGDYAGVTGGATVGVGADANVLVGGSNKTISLQPLSIEGNQGLNVAAGIAAISLHYQQQ
jgi:hypothetical protein